MELFKRRKPLSPSIKLRIGLLLILAGFFTAQWFTFSSLTLLIGISFSLLLSSFSRLSSCLALLALISLTYAQIRGTPPNNSLANFEHEVITLQGVVTSFPDQRIETNRVYLGGLSVKEESIGKWKKEKGGKILLVTKPYQILHYGTEVQITGKLSRPRNFQDFDYQKYLDRFGVSHLIRFPEKVEILSHDQGLWILRKAEQLRNSLEQSLEHHLSSPHSTIAMGILLGVKKELPPPVQEYFQHSGLMHILVVSGFNISVIMILCNYLLRRFGPVINILCSIGIVLFFVLMTGAEAPVVRAAIMGSLVGLALSSGRMSESRNVVLLSAVIIGLINPKVIQADLGFFFSFAATLGIILLVPILTPYFQWLTNRLEFRNVFLVTLASQIAVFPIQTYYFGLFPTGGLLANQLTEPVIPLAMLFSSFVAILGFLPDLIPQILSIPAWFALQFLLSVASWFASFPVLQIPKTLSIATGIMLFGFFLWQNLTSKTKELNLLKTENMIK